MQQQGPGHAYLSDNIASQLQAHAPRERLEHMWNGQDYHPHYVERPQYDGRILADSHGRPGGLEFLPRGSEYVQSQVAGIEDGLSASIMAVGRRIREEMCVIGHDQKLLQDNVLFEIDRIAARMSEQEAILRDLHLELRRLLELHGVETSAQKQHLLPETGFTSSSLMMQQQVRGQYQEPPPQMALAPPNFQPAARGYIPAGPELAAYTQSWPSSVAGPSVGGGSNTFRRTLDEAHM